MKRKNMNKKGFTLIELTLSMTFISVLLLMVTFIIIQMTSIYQKTLTVKAVNAAGREIIDDFSRRIRASLLPNASDLCSYVEEGVPRQDCVKDGAYKLLYHQYTSKIVKRSENTEVPTSGVFCTGQYSYLWNTGYALDPDNVVNAEQYRAKISYTDDSGNYVTRNDFRLVRVYDNSAYICQAGVNSTNYSFETNATGINYALNEQPEELISTSESALALYDLKMFKPARHNYSNQAYFSGTFTLSTLQGDVDIMANGDYCKSPPSDTISEFTYCAINKFNFAAQATGETDV